MGLTFEWTWIGLCRKSKSHCLKIKGALPSSAEISEHLYEGYGLRAGSIPFPRIFGCINTFQNSADVLFEGEISLFRFSQSLLANLRGMCGKKRMQDYLFLKKKKSLASSNISPDQKSCICFRSGFK